MARYINVDLTEAGIADKVQEITANADVFIAVRKVLGAFSAADVQEVRHGEWITEDKYTDHKTIRCSACGWAFNVDYIMAPYYEWCPHCGAKMDGKDESK